MQLQQLFALFNAGRYAEVEAQALGLVESAPANGLFWKALGVARLAQRKDAVDALRRASELLPSDADSHSNLGIALSATGQAGLAEASFRRALALSPRNAQLHRNLAVALMTQNQPEPAAQSLQAALAIEPGAAELHATLGQVQRRLGRHDDAVASFRRALALRPRYGEASSQLGLTLIEMGRRAEAEHSLVQGVEASGGDAKSLAAALSVMDYRADDPRFSTLESVWAGRDSLPIGERIDLDFAMGRAMEGLGRHDRAFEAYDEGNRLVCERRSFDEGAADADLAAVLGRFTPERLAFFTQLAAALPPDDETRRPIFIVGMPRSGSTLVEQVLASHPEVVAGGESPHFRRFLAPALDAADAQALAALRRLGRDYLDALWQRAPDAAFITDKLPFNFQWLGLVHLMLPTARIVHTLRDPLDTCFSCYAVNFDSGHAYAFDQRALGRQYRRYSRLMQHWQAVLPPRRIVDLRYEDLVAEPEAELRRLLEALALPWHEACLRFHEKAGTVATASAVQVRRPLYRSSVGRARAFVRHLQPLREALAESPRVSPAAP